MKLNSTTETIPCSYRHFTDIHPFPPANRTEGYQTLFRELEKDLSVKLPAMIMFICVQCEYAYDMQAVPFALTNTMTKLIKFKLTNYSHCNQLN